MNYGIWPFVLCFFSRGRSYDVIILTDMRLKFYRAIHVTTRSFRASELRGDDDPHKKKTTKTTPSRRTEKKATRVVFVTLLLVTLRGTLSTKSPLLIKTKSARACSRYSSFLAHHENPRDPCDFAVHRLGCWRHGTKPRQL